MFYRLKKHPEPKVTEKPETTREPSTKGIRTGKSDITPESTAPPLHAELKAAENAFVGIKEYNSASEIAEKIDKEIAETKSALGGYLRQLDDKRVVARKSKKLCDIVSKLANKKQSKENPSQLEVKGLEIVLDATTFHELIALESVVKSLKQQQQRLQDLQKARKALEPLDEFGDTEGIKYIVLEKEGIPERILLKIS
jgi:hypothetical protein